MTDYRERIARVERLGERIRSLSREIAERAERRKRKRNVTAFTGILLAVALLFGLSAVTTLGRKIDADVVAQMGRAELQNRLPSSRAALEQYLIDEAPRLVGRSLHVLIEMLPRIRVFLTKGLNEEIDRINAEFEDRIVHSMEECVRSTREMLDEQHPELSEREKIERLVAIVASNFNADISHATEALYPDYHDQMDRLRRSLTELRDKPRSELDDQQRVHRDIIETMLRLIIREQQALKNG